MVPVPLDLFIDLVGFFVAFMLYAGRGCYCPLPSLCMSAIEWAAVIDEQESLLAL